MGFIEKTKLKNVLKDSPSGPPVVPKNISSAVVNSFVGNHDRDSIMNAIERGTRCATNKLAYFDKDENGYDELIVDELL